MLYLLFKWWIDWADTKYAPESALFRATIAVLFGFLFVYLMGPTVIRWLVRKKIGDAAEFDHENLNKIMQSKQHTPTMGGVLIVGSIIASVLLLADVRNFYVTMALVCTIWLALLGGVDDWLKLTRNRRPGSRDGLRMWEKLVFQVALGALLAIFIYRHGEVNAEQTRWLDTVTPYATNYNILSLPFYNDPLPLSTFAFALIAIVVIAGTSNAVNLTDGMDGLASGCMVLCAFAFMVLTLVVGDHKLAPALLFHHIPGTSELAVLCGAIVGACMGFMWFNAHPAQVFMGDTGALPLGGLIGYVAIVTRQEAMLLIVGGVFVIEAVSVLLQIYNYKLTGRRIFRCAPIHHHFHLGGLAETQVVMRFWLLAALFAAFALATIKLR